MIYRLAVPADKEQVDALATKHGLAAPSVGACFVAEEDGKIVGFVSGGLVGLIETIVSENPIATHRLFGMIEGFLLSASPVLFATAMNGHATQLLNRHGYKPKAGQAFIKES